MNRIERMTNKNSKKESNRTTKVKKITIERRTIKQQKKESEMNQNRKKN